MELKPGKLYTCPGYSLLVCPTKEKSAMAMQLTSRLYRPRAHEVGGIRTLDYWTTVLHCKVQCIQPREVFMFLRESGSFCQILFGKHVGWIINRNWIKIEEAQSGF